MTRLFALVLIGLSLVPGPAAAQDGYPARPVRIVVPAAPGGGADAIARLLAQKFSAALGQQFFVENRPGAGNIIGLDAVAKSAPDGYTLLVGASTITINPALYKTLPYDAVRDFAPVTQLLSVPNVIVAHPTQPFRSLADLIAAAQAKPGALSYASAGPGSQLHLGMELLKSLAKIDLLHVPYKGAALAMNDVIAGHVPLMMANILSAKPQIDAGKLRALAVTTAARAPVLPDVPTVAEAGVAGYEVLNWFGLFAPAGTPAAIVTRLNAEARKALDAPEMRARLAAEGAVAVGNSPAAFADFIKAELATWAKVAKTANIQPQ